MSVFSLNRFKGQMPGKTLIRIWGLQKKQIKIKQFEKIPVFASDSL